jgi:hypothetical protein
MDRWGVYEALKSNEKADVIEIENTSAEEVKEGVIEYLLTRSKNDNKSIDELRNELQKNIDWFGPLHPKTLECSQELDKVVEVEQLKLEVVYFMKRCRQAEKLLEENNAFCPVLQKNEIAEFLKS